MADQGGSSSSVLRDYRKGNWTVQETMILIEAKKMDDERRMKRTSGESSEAGGGGGGRSKPAELRWKWVEDYCWRKGCFRSQNQCNDKWDNLMRDYKRVRDYERRRRLVVAPPLENNDNNNNNNGGGGGGGGAGDGDNNDDIDQAAGSYWKIEKNVRKDKNLPSNMLPQIYDALVEVVERKVGSSSSAAAAALLPQLAQPQPQPQPQIRVMGSGGGYGSSPNTPINNMGYLVERLNNVVQPVQLAMPPPLLQHHHHISAPMQALPDQSPPPTTAAAAPPPPPPQLPPPLPYSQPLLPTTTMCDSSDSDTSEYSDSPAKRRRKAAGGGRGEGTSGGGGGASTSPNEVGSAISKSASIIAEAIQACEEREERRHRELLSLHERRLKIEESKTEINRQGINGLVDAINKLANSILALASHNKEQSK